MGGMYEPGAQQDPLKISNVKNIQVGLLAVWPRG